MALGCKARGFCQVWVADLPRLPSHDAKTSNNSNEGSNRSRGDLERHPCRKRKHVLLTLILTLLQVCREYIRSMGSSVCSTVQQAIPARYQQPSDEYEVYCGGLPWFLSDTKARA
ncbi:hypothetical protein BBK36DRAFT_1140480 [Trichoderma citrinoviride]|uniref:Uncharacterized protein n=1 Tax=Trichoderma citrinoviride TaxID=58853 RepID=A0A2T4BBY3_9HYPO|nr:hypothetical protein BBK36DRAFT_1140480 [Trichoderma citrinoviride]PTB66699.1 hypothetical protein BBK36DRAFT_1140480 [Trichoderma citrinoviride]